MVNLYASVIAFVAYTFSLDYPMLFILLDIYGILGLMLYSVFLYI